MLSNKGRMVLVCASIQNYRNNLYREAFKKPMDLDGVLLVTVSGIKATRYQHTFGNNFS